MERIAPKLGMFIVIVTLVIFPFYFAYEILSIFYEIFIEAKKIIIKSATGNYTLPNKILGISIGLIIIYIEMLLPLLLLFILKSIFRFLTPVYSIYKTFVFLPFIGLGKLLKLKKFSFAQSNNNSKNSVGNQHTKISLQTNKREVIIPNPFRGILVVGGAGSGKTESFAIPLIREFSKQNFTGIVYDFKFPTLALEVEKHYQNSKSNVSRYYINLSNPLKSHRVNPLNPNYMPFSAYAREYASAIIKNLMKESIRKEDFWSRSATDLLTACIWFMKKEHPNMCDLPHILALITTPYKDLIKLLSKNIEVRAMIVSLVTAVESEASGQLAGVVGSLQGAVAQINTPEFMYIFGGDDFSLDLNNPNHPSLLVIGSNPTIANTLAPLCSLLITVASKQMNQPGKEKSFIMLDESPTVFIPNIEVIPNTGRSNKISTVLFIQDISQLIDGYGKEKSDVLFSSCANHFYGKVSTSQTADILSKQFGKQDKFFESRSTSRKTFDVLERNRSRSYSVQERDVFRNSDFMNLSVGHFIGSIAETGEKYVFEKFLIDKEKLNIDLDCLLNSKHPSEIQNHFEKVHNDIIFIINNKSLYDDVERDKQLFLLSDNEDEDSTKPSDETKSDDDEFDEMRNVLFSEDINRNEKLNEK